MAIVSQTNQKLGGTETALSIGVGGAIRPYEVVVDIEKALADLTAAGTTFVQGTDSLQIPIMTLPVGTYFAGIDAEIVDTLVITGSPTTDLGFDASDPDDYIDAQSTTAIGRYTMVATAPVTPVIITTARTIYIEFNGSTLITSGKVAVTIWAGMAAKANVGRASHRTYAH